MHAYIYISTRLPLERLVVLLPERRHGLLDGVAELRRALALGSLARLAAGTHAAAEAVGTGALAGDAGGRACGEMGGGVGRCAEVCGGVGRCAEIRGGLLHTSGLQVELLELLEARLEQRLQVCEARGDMGR